jgi:hypothetical protein
MATPYGSIRISHGGGDGLLQVDQEGGSVRLVVDALMVLPPPADPHSGRRR